MSDQQRPRLRQVESFPVGEPDGQVLFALRDPEGFASPVVLPYAAAVLASLMDGSRTLDEIQQQFEQQFGQKVGLADLERLIGQLEERCFLDSPRFRARWKAEIETYLNSRVRPAAHAGGAYAGDPDELRVQLAELFTCAEGPGSPGDYAANGSSGRLCGVLSPHIDLHRGGPAFAWAYKKVVEESDADLFVIFGTAHNWMRNLFSVSRKHFETPLGTVETDLPFVSRLAAALAAQPAGQDIDLFADELAHRQEHSIEFQSLFLQYLLGSRRPFKVVPILTGSFHEFVSSGIQPAESPQVTAFVAAVQAAARQHKGRICYISGGDLAHIGQRFGDRALLDKHRLLEQSEDDRLLLEAACRADAQAFFSHVASQQDRSRICGLSPTYTMLQVMQPQRGEFLKYSQAVEQDGTSCVSFASLAFYDG